MTSKNTPSSSPQTGFINILSVSMVLYRLIIMLESLKSAIEAYKLKIINEDVLLHKKILPNPPCPQSEIINIIQVPKDDRGLDKSINLLLLHVSIIGSSCLSGNFLQNSYKGKKGKRNKT